MWNNWLNETDWTEWCAAGGDSGGVEASEGAAAAERMAGGGGGGGGEPIQSGRPYGETKQTERIWWMKKLIEKQIATMHFLINFDVA